MVAGILFILFFRNCPVDTGLLSYVFYHKKRKSNIANFFDVCPSNTTFMKQIISTYSIASILFMNAILHLIVCQNHLYADDLLFSCQDIFCSLSKVVNLSNLKSFQRSWHFVLSRNSILKLHLNFLHVRLLSLFSFKKTLGAKTSPQVGI